MDDWFMASLSLTIHVKMLLPGLTHGLSELSYKCKAQAELNLAITIVF